MEITHLGHSSFKLRGRSGSVVTDPYNPEMVGLKFPKQEANVVTVSHLHGDHDFISGVEGAPIVISGPGEYEVKGIKIIGISAFHDNSKGSERGKNTVYRINVDGISIVHCGDLGHKFDDKSVEVLDGVDVLLIPVGGFYTIDASMASEVVSQLDPKIIIPMHYQVKGLKDDLYSKLADVGLFLKEMGKEQMVPVPKLSVTREKMPAEPAVIILE